MKQKIIISIVGLIACWTSCAVAPPIEISLCRTIDYYASSTDGVKVLHPRRFAQKAYFRSQKYYLEDYDDVLVLLQVTHGGGDAWWVHELYGNFWYLEVVVEGKKRATGLMNVGSSRVLYKRPLCSGQSLCLLIDSLCVHSNYQFRVCYMEGNTRRFSSNWYAVGGAPAKFDQEGVHYSSPKVHLSQLENNISTANSVACFKEMRPIKSIDYVLVLENPFNIPIKFRNITQPAWSIEMYLTGGGIEHGKLLPASCGIKQDCLVLAPLEKVAIPLYLETEHRDLVRKITVKYQYGAQRSEAHLEFSAPKLIPCLPFDPDKPERGVPIDI